VLHAALTLAWVVAGPRAVSADETNHKYIQGEEVKVWSNKVGPYHNPQESYLYHSLPFCRPSKQEQKPRTLGDALEGNTLLNTGIALKFMSNRDRADMCKVDLNEDMASSFDFAVARQYWYQLYLDELPVWAMVGEVAEADYQSALESKATNMIYTHMKFDIGYNQDRIVQVNLTSKEPRPIKPGTQLVFSFGVSWHPMETRFEDRFRRYLDYSFFEHQIHTFAILNSFMMVIFLVGLVSLILLRTLRQDYAAIFKDAEGELDELDRDLADETGWKKIHGDVFRDPMYWPVLCTMVGVGYQLLLMMFGVLVCALIGTLYVGRGAGTIRECNSHTAICS
jgi:transmembrane 9 superfamily protein 3